MKTLEIPRITIADTEDVSAVTAALEQQGARAAINEVNWREQYPYTPLSAVTAAHDGQRLYLDFFVRCNYLRAEVWQPLGPVAEDSCVEFFVQPIPGGEYWNFEMNCIGVINASHRLERPHPTRLTPQELTQIGTYPSCGRRPFCEIQGLFSWNLLVTIPLSLIGVEYQGKPLEMRANFNKCASATSAPHYLTWNPVKSPKPDFHHPECFGRIIIL